MPLPLGKSQHCAESTRLLSPSNRGPPIAALPDEPFLGGGEARPSQWPRRAIAHFPARDVGVRLGGSTARRQIERADALLPRIAIAQVVWGAGYRRFGSSDSTMARPAVDAAIGPALRRD
jgi:hypothetical protein